MDGLFFLIDVFLVLLAILISGVAAFIASLFLAYLFEVNSTLNRISPIKNARLLVWWFVPIFWVIFTTVLVRHWL